MPYATCATCGRPFQRRTQTHRHCNACEKHGRAYRSPTTRAQNSEYRRNRAAMIGLPCTYCGQPADTADHKQPVAAGGDNSPTNLQPACSDCNLSKGAGRYPSFNRALLILIGAPGTGKSTWANTIPGAHTIAYDDFRAPGPWNPGDNHEIMASWRAAVARAAHGHGPVIVDGTGAQPQLRAHWRHIAEETGRQAIAVDFTSRTSNARTHRPAAAVTRVARTLDRQAWRDEDWHVLNPFPTVPDDDHRPDPQLAVAAPARRVAPGFV